MTNYTKQDIAIMESMSFAVCFDKPWKNWLFYSVLIGVIIAFCVGIAIAGSKKYEQKFKLITPYGTQIFTDENRPYLDYDVRFTKGDTTVYVVKNKVYKLVEVK